MILQLPQRWTRFELLLSRQKFHLSTTLGHPQLQDRSQMKYTESAHGEDWHRRSAGRAEGGFPQTDTRAGDDGLLLNHWPIPNPRAPCETSRHVTDNVWLILFSANIMKMKFNVMYIYMNPKGAVMQDATGQVLVRLIHGLLLSTCMRMSVHTLPTHRWDLRFAPAHGILIKATDAEELWLEYYRTDHYKECPLELSSLIISFISNICFQIEHMF